MNLYIYEGPVYQFGEIVIKQYRGATRAITPSRALANIAFTCKIKKLKLDKEAKIKLDPKFLRLEEE